MGILSALKVNLLHLTRDKLNLFWNTFFPMILATFFCLVIPTFTLSTILIMNLIEKTTGAPHAIFHFQTTYNYLQKFVWNCQQDTQVNDKAEVMRFSNQVEV